MCVNVAVCPQDPNICVSIETVLGGMHFVFATSIFDVLLVYDYPWAKGPKHKTMLLRPWKDHTHDNSRVQSPSNAKAQATTKQLTPGPLPRLNVQRPRLNAHCRDSLPKAHDSRSYARSEKSSKANSPCRGLAHRTGHPGHAHRSSP